MGYAQAVSALWRHHELNLPDVYRGLVRYATLAASSHNTQPWKFKLEPEQITILPDYSRRCPAVDPDDHHLFASLGCAVENLGLAAEAAGLKGHYSYDATRPAVRLTFDGMPAQRSNLFCAIPDRQCSRATYDGAALSSGQLGLLEKAGQGNGVAILLLTAPRDVEQVGEYVAAGNIRQFSDSQWVQELQSWIRFNGREAMRSGDGLYGPVMGSPSVPRWLGSMFMRIAFSAEKQNRKDIAQIRSSSTIAVIHSDADDPAHWIEAGRCYERMALQATVMGLRTAFINQPVEVPALRPQFAAFLGIGNRRPDLVVRIGRGPSMPRSLRRPLEEVLI